MKSIVSLLGLAFLTVSCGGVSEETGGARLLQGTIGTDLPFNKVRIAHVESGAAAIADGCWCYWIDPYDNVCCVNGNAKAIYRMNNGVWADAPIRAAFADIYEIAE